MRSDTLTVVVGLILCWIFVEDMLRFRIRNVLIIALISSFALDCILGDRLALMVPHSILAVLGLGVLSGCFALRMMGGGDVKLLSAALLWVGPEGCVVFAIALLFCTLLYLAGAWAGWLPQRSRGGRTLIPFGPSIAAAWIIHGSLVVWVAKH
ncbi:A24 family peptidase [Lichenifustis flavocetrariae]|uniref:Prepilin peptidase n=1 Tax=Lichenifustis flavocetrariae TaxID=2949735 RepID=A0AA41Z318_9HYPH|nr:prepilin peptidase [Lichenifustis flavocetrariae]MCW6511938.1 prepilin peptidase [Lichenifustis flavocetrariae]